VRGPRLALAQTLGASAARSATFATNLSTTARPDTAPAPIRWVRGLRRRHGHLALRSLVFRLKLPRSALMVRTYIGEDHWQGASRALVHFGPTAIFMYRQRAHGRCLAGLLGSDLSAGATATFGFQVLAAASVPTAARVSPPPWIGLTATRACHAPLSFARGAALCVPALTLRSPSIRIDLSEWWAVLPAPSD
jgi:hypothetical protein